MGAGNKYPGFNYFATELSAYTLSVGVYIIALKDGSIIHFTPNDIAVFEKWLTGHHIRDIRKDNGITSKQQPKH